MGSPSAVSWRRLRAFRAYEWCPRGAGDRDDHKGKFLTHHITRTPSGIPLMACSDTQIAMRQAGRFDV